MKRVFAEGRRRIIFSALSCFGLRLGARRRFFACLSAGFVAASVCPAPAQAFELFGIHLWGKKKPQAEIEDPKSYQIKILPLAPALPAPQSAPNSAAAKALQKQNAADEKLAERASALWTGRKMPLPGSGGLLAKARGDYARILAAFYAQGRYGPVISIGINGREAADIPYGTEFPPQNQILVRTEGGPVYRFSRADILTAGQAELSAQAGKRQALAVKAAGFTPGAEAKAGSIAAAESAAVESWRQQGYAKAQVTGHKIIADHAARAVDAEITVAPGRQARFGGLALDNVSESPRMNGEYVTWLTGLKQGELYSPAALAAANARLSGLDVFRSVNFNEAEAISPNGLLPITLTVQERPLHRFGGGGSYASADGLGLSAYWLHRNLFGHAERLRLDAAVSHIAGANNNSSSKDFSYSVGGVFTRPGALRRDTDYTASLKAEREVLDDYTSKSVAFSNGFTRSFNARLSGYIYANAAQTQVKDDVWGKRDFTVLGLSGGLLYDSRDNKADAAKGLYAELAAQPFYEAHYGNLVGKATAEGRVYFALERNKRLVAAFRGKIGSIGGASVAEIPSNLLFFAGGGGSVRGYAYRSLGAYKKNDTMIGGRSLLEGSAELRAMATASLGMVAFVDAGLVGKDSAPDFSRDAKLGAGLGVRYKTGMGPLRFDVALPLNREKGDSRYGLYIGIGQAF